MTPLESPILHVWEYEETYTNRFERFDFIVKRYEKTTDWCWQVDHFGEFLKADCGFDTREMAALAAEAWFKELPYYKDFVAKWGSKA